MSTNLDDKNYDYFRTTEEKYKARPKRETDEECIRGLDWRCFPANSLFDYSPDVIYRRRKPASQYPRWVKCSERLPRDEYYKLVCLNSKFDSATFTGDYWHNESGEKLEVKAWLDIGPIPPPPKAEPEKDEFEEWWKNIIIAVFDLEDWQDTAKNLAKSSWHAALASKESKKGGA